MARTPGNPRDATALVLVDLMGTFDHEDGARLLVAVRRDAAAIEGALAAARRRGWRVVYVNDSRDSGGDPDAVVRAALAGPGGDVLAPLAPASGEPVLLKERYSGFDGTALGELLDRWGVRRVVVAGTVTEMCVEATAVDAARRGLETRVLLPASVSLDTGEAARALRNLARRDVVLDHRL